MKKNTAVKLPTPSAKVTPTRLGFIPNQTLPRGAVVSSEPCGCRIEYHAMGVEVFRCRVHSAGPELLEALKACLTHIEIGEGHKAKDFDCYHTAKAAIAKAVQP